VIRGFCCEVDEIYALLGNYAAYIGLSIYKACPERKIQRS